MYHDALVALARAAHGAGRLPVADGSASVDNPLCGDQVGLDVRVDADGHITQVGHRVRGCLLCEASASWIGEHAPGSDAAQVAAVSAALRSLLADGTQPPAGAALWDGIEVFTPVHATRSRHRCVLLPFEALQAAIEATAEGDR